MTKKIVMDRLPVRINDTPSKEPTSKFLSNEKRSK